MSLVGELQTILDESGGAAFWVGGQLQDALNGALLDVWAQQREWQTTTATVTFTSGNEFVQLPVTSIMIPQYVLGTGGKKLFAVGHEELEDWSWRWRNTPAGPPHWIVLWDASRLRAFPKPNATYQLPVVGVGWPTEIVVGSQEEVSVDPLLRKSILHKAASNLLQLTQPDLSDQHEGMGEEFKRRYARQYRRGQGPMALHPGKGWEVAQGGSIRQGSKYGR